MKLEMLPKHINTGEDPIIPMTFPNISQEGRIKEEKSLSML